MPTFSYNGQIIEYRLNRRAKRNVNFRIKENGEIYISAPRYVSKQELEKMISKRADWLIEAQNKVISKTHNKIEKTIKNGSITFFNGKQYQIKITPSISNDVSFYENIITIKIKSKYFENDEYINKFFKTWLKEYEYYLCDKLIDKYIELFKKYKLKKPDLTIREMTSRWGSCIPVKNKITINQKLIYFPFSCLEYVVLHEVSHLIEPNHSPKFYALIENIMPDWKTRRQLLNSF